MWRMLRDITRFYRDANAFLADPDDRVSLRDFLATGGYSREFLDLHLIPMGAAVWSADPATFDEFPARSLLTFLSNHGLLGVRDRPQWRSIHGGSRTYVQAIADRFAGEIRLSAPVHRVERHGAADDRRVDVDHPARPRHLRPRGARRPQRPGAADARGADGRRARRARERALPTEPGDAPHRRLAAVAATARLGGVELRLPAGRARGRSRHRHVRHDDPAAPAGQRALPRHAQQRRAHRSRSRDPLVRLRPPGVRRCRRSRPRAGSNRSTASTGCTSAAPGGATASTRTA